MKKTIGVFVFAGILFWSNPVGWVDLPAKIQEGMSNGQLTVSVSTYVARLNIFESVMNVPYEVAVMVLSNGTLYTMTNQFSDRVVFPDLEEFFKKEGATLADVVLFYHSHLAPHRFSEPDRRLYFLLKRYGFKGVFGIYYPATKTVLIWRE